MQRVTLRSNGNSPGVRGVSPEEEKSTGEKLCL